MLDSVVDKRWSLNLKRKALCAGRLLTVHVRKMGKVHAILNELLHMCTNRPMPCLTKSRPIRERQFRQLRHCPTRPASVRIKPSHDNTVDFLEVPDPDARPWHHARFRHRDTLATIIEPPPMERTFEKVADDPPPIAEMRAHMWAVCIKNARRPAGTPHQNNVPAKGP